MIGLNLGTLFAEVKLDTSSLHAAMGPMDRAIGNIGNKFVDITKKVAKTGVVLAGVAGAFTLKEAIKGASNLEQSKVAFETMLGSGEKADAFLKDLYAFAKKTPFEIEGLMDSSKKLLAFGIDAKDVLPNLKSLGNIAAGVGNEKLPFLINAFGQVRAKGRLMGQELLQFTEAGVPLLEELSKSFGKSTAEIQDMVTAGEIGFEDVRTALAGMSGEGGRFNDLMAKQALTFSGVMSNIKDTFNITLTNIANDSGLFEIIKNSADTLLSAMESNVDVVKDFATAFIQGAIELGESFQKIVEDSLIMESIQNLFENLKELWSENRDGIMDFINNAFSILVEVIKGAIDLISGLIDQYQKHDEMINNVIKVVGLLVVAYEGVKTAMEIKAALAAFATPQFVILAALVVAVAAVKTKYEELSSEMETLATDTSPGLQDSINKLDEAIENAATDEDRERFKKLRDETIQQKAEVDRLTERWSTFHGKVGIIFEGLGTALGEFTGKVIAKMGNMFSSIGEGLGKLVQKFADTFTNIKDFIIQSNIDTIKKIFNGLFDFLNSLFTRIGNALGSAIETGVNTAKATVNLLRDAFVGVFSGIPDTVRYYIEQVKSAISGAIDAIVTKIWEVPGAIGSAFSSAVEKAKSLVPQIPNIDIPGFARGVENFSGGLAIVGERGPELVNLPKGSDVIPNDQIGAGTLSGTTINVNVSGNTVQNDSALAGLVRDEVIGALNRRQEVNKLFGTV